MKRREIITAIGAVVLASGCQDAFAQTPSEPHPPRYKALESSTARCVSTGEDCLRHCLGMMAMKDTNMAACADSVVQLVAACRALQTLASLSSPFTPAFAKDVAAVCGVCEKECRKFDKITACKLCAEACKACADDCRAVTA
jgi:Cys-rich four helix bundle protein (predicted Tat secretion target)